MLCLHLTRSSFNWSIKRKLPNGTFRDKFVKIFAIAKCVQAWLLYWWNSVSLRWHSLFTIKWDTENTLREKTFSSYANVANYSQSKLHSQRLELFVLCRLDGKRYCWQPGGIVTCWAVGLIWVNSKQISFKYFF